MANGFVPAFLRNLKLITGGNAPVGKITPKGMLAYLLKNGAAPNIINEGKIEGGIYRDMIVKTRKRGVKKYVSNTDDCEIDLKPAYTETNVDLTLFSKLSLFLDDETIGKYEEEVTKLIAIPGIMDVGSQVKVAPPMIVQEFWDMILENANGLLDDINTGLLTAQVFGRNQRTGSNASSTINISKDANVRGLQDGMPLILTDIQTNELTGRPSIVGSGMFHNYLLANGMRPGTDNGGFSDKAMTDAFDFFYDPAAADVWGANQIGVFAPGAVAFIERNKFTGFKAGWKGGDFFCTMRLPIQDSLGDRAISALTLDVQFHYFTCPQEVIGGPYFGTQTIDRGWQVILSKNYDLFNEPSDAYDSTDRLYQNNGTLRYTITNECDTCD